MAAAPKPRQPWQSPSLQQLSVSLDTTIDTGSGGDAGGFTNTKIG